MMSAPMIHAQTASGPANPAARHAPNSQPEPMIEPRPISINANAPTSRRMALSFPVMQFPVRNGRAAMIAGFFGDFPVAVIFGAESRIQGQVSSLRRSFVMRDHFAIRVLAFAVAMFML